MVFEIEVEEARVDDETEDGWTAPADFRLESAAGGEVGVDERGGAVGDGLGEDERPVTFGHVEVELGTRAREIVGGGEAEKRLGGTGSAVLKRGGGAGEVDELADVLIAELDA